MRPAITETSAPTNTIICFPWDACGGKIAGADFSKENADDDERCRARGALEDYGFVARQCAVLLLAPDPYERTSAAKMLGDIKSPASLPFLLEAIYDHEPTVRNQAVLSIGELERRARVAGAGGG